MTSFKVRHIVALLSAVCEEHVVRPVFATVEVVVQFQATYCQLKSLADSLTKFEDSLIKHFCKSNLCLVVDLPFYADYMRYTGIM